MWNHAQNCTPGGDEDTNEQDRSLLQKERVEKSLDLTQYLKYLDQLFGQGTSESESSDGEEADRPRTFTEFRQPPVTIQHLERPYTHNHCLAGPSTLSEGSNHVNNFQFKAVDNFHAESNISSSSLSSIDSGTSSLSLNLSSDTYLDISQPKTDDAGSRKSSGNESTRQGNSFGAEDDKSVANSPDKDKKSQKKKRSARNSSEALPRQHKPSSGGKGNNGSRGGGGAGGSTSGGSSNDSSEGSGGSSSSNQNTSSNNGSPGAKSHSGKQNLQKQVDSSPEVILESHVQGISMEETCAGINHCADTASTDLQTLLGIPDTNSDSLLLSDDLSDNFESVHAFDSSDISSFPLNSLLDNIPDEETSLSDFISLSASAHLSNSPSTATQSTNFFGKVAQAAASFVNKRPKGLLNNSNTNVSFKVDTKKRKVESKVDQVDDIVKPTDKQKQSKIEYFNAKRRKIYINISKKEVIKEQKVRAITFKESIIIRRKLAYACARAVRKNELRSQKCMKESEGKVRQLAHEPEIQEKGLSRVLSGTKISEGKLRRNLTATNTSQDNRFHRLITLMELFASRLLNNNSVKVNLLHETNKRTSQNLKSSEAVYSSNSNIVDRAIKEHHNLVKLLDMTGLYAQDQAASVEVDNRIFEAHEGVLKKHQIIGVNWIYNLFVKGFNGILADESGLGKKAQVTGFLSYLAESHKLWGPFLIVAPSSSVSYWHQVLNRLCPKFKTIKYSGNTQDKKIVRQVWEKDCTHTKKDSFHIIITSYSVMVADLTYFSKIKWQYLIVDDSQNAITSSTKWMAILSFRCRSKLLLCSNPPLNSISHLCSYLYFIMPSLFDSQKELSEWLLKELETSNKRGEDLVSSSRLKMITQNFMLRREQQDVEITDSVDVLLHCPLTKRQRQIYSGLLDGINLVETLNYLKNCQPQEIRNRVRNALNLSLQLRMVCNHPSLIEERACATSFWMETPLISFPKLVYQLESTSGVCNKPLLRHLFCIFNTYNVYESLYRYNSKSQNNEISTWSFARLCKLNWKDVEGIFEGNYESRLNHLVNFQTVLQKIAYDLTWVDNRDSSYLINHPTALLQHIFSQNKVLSGLVFTSLSPFVCTWRKCRKVLIANSIQYQTLKSRYIFRGKRNAEIKLTEPIHSLYPALEYPDFLECYSSNVYSKGYMPLVSCKTFHREIMTKENRVLISELVSMSGTSTTNVPNMVSSIKEKFLSLNWCHRFPTVHDRLIGGSGKMMVLYDMLSGLKQARRRVLIVTYIKSSLRILEELLKTMSSEYVIVDGCNKIKDESFIYLLFAHSSLSDLKIYVDTIIFFDHDWDINMEEQKTTLLQKIGHAGSMDCYRLISSETVEERMLALMMERNNASPTLYKDMLENSQVSSIPALKNLYSVLMSEWQRNKGVGNATKPCLSITKSSLSQSSPEAKSKCLKQAIYTATSCIGGTHTDDMTDVHFMNENEGPDSAAPSCSEDHDLYIDDDDDDDVTGCQIEDNFNLSFDEGYMGMSPESFEDTTIKLDYEEHSLPKRSKMGRGSGKRGRPPSRARFNKRVDFDGSDTSRRGPGRPRLKTVGPAHQGNRGRRPGRPPLTKKTESQGLASLSSGQNVFAFYSSADLELS